MRRSLEPRPAGSRPQTRPGCSSLTWKVGMRKLSLKEVGMARKSTRFGLVNRSRVWNAALSYRIYSPRPKTRTCPERVVKGEPICGKLELSCSDQAVEF